AGPQARHRPPPEDPGHVRRRLSAVQLRAADRRVEGGGIFSGRARSRFYEERRGVLRRSTALISKHERGLPAPTAGAGGVTRQRPSSETFQDNGPHMKSQSSWRTALSTARERVSFGRSGISPVSRRSA